MKKERNIISIDEYGRLNMLTDTANIWMTVMELAELFGTTAGAVNSGIKAIIKSDTLHDNEVCKYVRLENGNGADVYNMEVIIAFAFRIHAQGATRLREYILRTLDTVGKRPAINILMTCSRKTDEYSRQIFN